MITMAANDGAAERLHRAVSPAEGGAATARPAGSTRSSTTATGSCCAWTAREPVASRVMAMIGLSWMPRSDLFRGL
jgi:hypothetical protein